MTQPLLSRAEKLAIKRELAEAMVRAGISLNDSTSPGQLALRHDPTQVQRPHLEAIDNQLTPLLAHPNRRVMIFTPPQLGKSNRVSRWFPFWWMGMHPRDRQVLASYAAGLAVTHGAAVRELVRMYGTEYGLVLDPTEATKASWRIRAGGGLRSVGVRGGLTGQPMDLGIIDDPFAGRTDAESPLQREAVWQWYSAVWSSRKSPTFREVLVCTRWHQDDLAGRLLDQDGRVEEGGEWYVLHLPAIAMAPDADKGIYPDPLGREPGEPISHPRIDAGDKVTLLAHWARQKKTATARDWNALYQGVPFDAEGALLTAENIRAATTQPPNDFRRKVIAVDPSGDGRDSAGIVAAGLDPDGHAWFLQDHTAVLSTTQWPQQVCLVAADNDADRVVVETNFGGGMATTLIRQAWKLLQDDPQEERITQTMLCPLITEVRARQSKVLRAEPVAQAVLTGRVRFAAGVDLKQLVTEWQMWEPGSTWSPGALDASVYAAMELLPAIPRGGRGHNPARTRRQTSGARGGPAGRRIA